MSSKPKGKARTSAPTPKPAGKAKAKAKSVPEEDPRIVIAREGQEFWEKNEDGGVIKLAGFADLIRAVNIKKNRCFGDDPGLIIRENWKKCGGFSKKELQKAEFMHWYAVFTEEVEAKVLEIRMEEEKKEEEKAAQVAANAARYEGTGTWSLKTADLKEALEEAFKREKTPLIIDNTEGFLSETYFTYSGAHIIECKKMIMDHFSKKVAVEDVLEECRGCFLEKAHCFKYGPMVVFRLANTAWDPQMFKSEVFPTLKLLDTSEWKKLLGSEQAGLFKGSPFYKMCKEDDDKTEHEYTGINDKFRVCAVSQFSEDDFNEYMGGKFPVELCQKIKITSD